MSRHPHPYSPLLFSHPSPTTTKHPSLTSQSPTLPLILSLPFNPLNTQTLISLLAPSLSNSLHRHLSFPLPAVPLEGPTIEPSPPLSIKAAPPCRPPLLLPIFTEPSPPISISFLKLPLYRLTSPTAAHPGLLPWPSPLPQNFSNPKPAGHFKAPYPPPISRQPPTNQPQAQALPIGRHRLGPSPHILQRRPPPGLIPSSNLAHRISPT